MPTAATKPAPEPANPLTEAEVEQEQARSEAAAITEKIKALTRSGPGFDQGLHARLKIEQESALKALRAADLQLEEQKAAATAPISARVIDKIRRRRRRVEDLHASTLARMGETNHLRGHIQGLKNSIAALRESWEFRADQQEMQNAYLFPRDPEARDHPAPARRAQKTPQSMEKLALLERDLETTAAELKIAAAAQIAASARWEAEKAVLDAWESAVRSLGASAGAVLDALPAAGAQSLGGVTRQDDFRDGIPGHTTPMIR